MVGSQAQKMVVSYLKDQFEISERRACELIKAARPTIRYKGVAKEDKSLRERIVHISLNHKSFGYRRIVVLLKRKGLLVNQKKVYRLYVQEGLSLKKKTKKKYVNRYKEPLEKCEKPNQRWAMDFMSDSLADGRKLRLLNIIDTFSRECPTMLVASSLPSKRVIDALDRLSFIRGLPESIVLDNGPEYTSKLIQKMG